MITTSTGAQVAIRRLPEPDRRIFSPMLLIEWACDEARHGESAIYHFGPWAEGQTCEAARELYAAGLVDLVQMRQSLQSDQFFFIATRTAQDSRGQRAAGF